MTSRLARLAAPALAAFHLAGHADTFNDPVDRFVSRARPKAEERFSRGDLGILLTSYHRGPLYEAFRVLNVPRADLEKEDRSPEPSEKAGDENAIAEWRAAREEFVKEPPRLELDIYRKLYAGSLGSFVNCTPGAFAQATRTLAGLKQDPSLKPRDVREWVQAQDTVFEFCTSEPGTAQAPKVPSALGASAPLKLRQLRQYQIAAANFYGSQYGAAEAQFTAIAQSKDHPLRNWAAIASVRSILREASLDLAWQRRFDELYHGSAPKAERDAAMAEAAKQSNERKRAAMASIDSKVQAMLADPQWKPIHATLASLQQQAVAMIAPHRAYLQLGQQLARVDGNPYRQGTLERWEQIGERILDFGPPGPDVTPLRERWAYFDWIRTIQGCTDNVRSPNHGGRCEQEHEHALQAWRHDGTQPWLVATLMTASRLSPANKDAVDAALRTDRNAPAWLTLQYHAARVLRESGRVDLARPLVEKLLAEPQADASADNLLRQQRVAMGTGLADVLPWLPRRFAGQSTEASGVGADGDELLNRRLSSEDQIALAGSAATPPVLQRQLAVAAWLRADVLEKFDVADRAARVAMSVQPSMRAAAEHYLAQSGAEAKHASALRTLLVMDVSPQAFRHAAPRFAAPRRGSNAGSAWCSFDSADAKEAQRMERMLPLPSLAVDAARRDDELARLRQAGSATQWIARQTIALAKRQPTAPDTPRFLRAAAQTLDNDLCPHPEAAAVKAEIDRLLSAR